MINTRNGHLVHGKHAIPVREVVNRVCDRQDMEWITNRYPMQDFEVMECIDCVADLDNLDYGVHLELSNGSDTVGEITIETRSISDTFFVKCIQYGKIFSPSVNDFNLLYDKGFRICAIESFEDVLNNSIGYESSELHSVVYNAIIDITDEEFDKQEFVNFLKGQDEAD
jgi:uncharacterized protein (DUF433 family)